MRSSLFPTTSSLTPTRMDPLFHLNWHKYIILDEICQPHGWAGCNGSVSGLCGAHDQAGGKGSPRLSTPVICRQRGSPAQPILSARGSARFLSRSLLRPEPNPPQAAAQKARAGPRTGITTPTRLLVSWPGALQGPIRPTLSTGLGVRMAFFLLLFLSAQTGKRPGRWAMLFWGAPFTSRTGSKSLF